MLPPRSREGGGRSLPHSLLICWFLCSAYSSNPAHGAAECSVPPPPRPPEISLRDRGGLSSLVGSAESTRSVVVGGELPYKFIRTRAREAYNGSRPLTTSQFVKEWTSYTQNALFVGGFVLFVGVLLPGAAIALWTFCDCCYEDDEEEEQENRNLTWQAQVVVWSLAVAMVTALLVLLVMVGLLLGANSWITEGVNRGSTVVRRTIPQLVEMRDTSLQSLEEILIDNYENLTFDLQNSVLDDVAPAVSESVSKLHSPLALSLSNTVESFLSETPPELLDLVTSLTGTLSTLHALTTSLGHSLTSLQHSCSLLTMEADNSSNSLSLLLSECENFTFDLSSLTPVSRWNEVGGVSTTDGRWLLGELQSLLNNSKTGSIILPNTMLEEYLNEMALNLSTQVNSTSAAFFSSLGANLSLFTEEVIDFYNSSLPLSSQSHVEHYLGHRHLGNWEWFRSALTITFAVLVFAGSLPLLLALGRGLYYVTSTYRYSDSAAYDRGAHQAGMLIKKVAFSLTVICLLSASSTGICLSVAGVMGKACGNHNNFTELLANVVDNPRTWSPDQDTVFYPLAAVLLNMSHYPLRVSDTLESCRSNVSLFRSFHLEQQYDLEERIWLNPLEKRLYREDMQEIHLHLGPADLTSPTLHQLLTTLATAAELPVEWAELTSLSPASSFQPEFVGLEELQLRLEKILAVLTSVNGSALVANVSDAVEEALTGLHNLREQLQPGVAAISANASELQSALSLPSPSLSLLWLSGNVTLSTRTKSNHLVSLASERINTQLELYLTSAITTLSCSIGRCLHLSSDYDTFSSAVCGDVVPGMDLYWMLLLIMLAISVLLMYLSLLVASRFVSLEMWKSNRKNPKFDFTGALTRQGYSILWQLVGLSIYIWWIVYLARNEVVREELCPGRGGCCRDCVWGFGTLFLIAAAGVGGVSRGYQIFTIYMTKQCKAMKYRRYWIDRKKAVNFYTQLTLVFLQDLPFLVLVALSSSELGFLSVPAFYSLTITLLTILTHLLFLTRQRTNVPTYLAWLKMELAKLGLVKRTYTPSQDPPPNSNGGMAGISRRGGALVGNGHINPLRAGYEGSGSDHSENSSQGTFQEHHEFEFHPPRLSDIPEYPEGGLDSVGSSRRPGGGGGPPRMVLMEPNFNDDESEMSEQNSQFQSRVRLDRDIEQDSEAYLQRRRYAIDNFEKVGVEIAAAHYHHRDMDASTISDSYYYGSRNSIELQGYMSSSQAPDTNSYHGSSDCRDEDGDSVYSQARYRLPVPSFMGEVTVDV